MRTETILKHNARVPRYTSYPTAVQFRPDIGPARYADWLGQLPDSSISAYIHVPFCHSLCWYCGCNTQVVRRQSVHERYVSALETEIALVRRHAKRAGRVGYVHLGGGTPNILPPSHLFRIVSALATQFGLDGDAVRSIEIDPRYLDAEAAAAIGILGFTRASVGLQDLNADVQRAINRVQSWDQVVAAVDLLRGHGVEDLNLDLMYGLPHQTEGRLRRTVEGALALAPERIALFGYAHVPWMKAQQRLIVETALPDPQARLRMAQGAGRTLVSAGYIAVGMDHYVRAGTPFAQALASGRIRRNFQGYTDDAARVLLGFGASAIGDLGDGMVQNSSDTKAYLQSIAHGELATARGVARSDEDRFRGAVIEDLMCRHSVDLAALCRAHGRSLDDLAEDLTRLQVFADDGLIVRDGARLNVTSEGEAVIRAICATFDRYINTERPAHAIAV